MFSRVLGLDNVTQVSAGGGHSCARRSNQRLLCWGRNTEGQLGIGNLANQLSPQPLSLGHVAAISAGSAHTCALRTDSRVFCWGDNTFGQLGLGMAGDPQETPQYVRKYRGFSALSAGGKHTCALWSAADPNQACGVACWGNNYNGQLGSSSAGTGRAGGLDVWLSPQLALAPTARLSVAPSSSGALMLRAIYRGDGLNEESVSAPLWHFVSP